ncbi:MAG TPA: YkvA family protein [Rubricoccaceae bacterium]|nr:YkvA family protein [Rubricoccaceae bacterium]
MTELDSPARLLSRYRHRAQREAKRPGRVRSIARRAGAKLREHRDQLGTLRDDLPVLLRLARAWARGDYRAIPWKSLVLLVAGLLYFLAPADAVPDFIPVLGFLDDAAVIAYVLRAIQTDVRAFEEWEAEADAARALPPPGA